MLEGKSDGLFLLRDSKAAILQTPKVQPDGASALFDGLAVLMWLDYHPGPVARHACQGLFGGFRVSRKVEFRVEPVVKYGFLADLLVDVEKWWIDSVVDRRPWWKSHRPDLKTKLGGQTEGRWFCHGALMDRGARRTEMICRA